MIRRRVRVPSLHRISTWILAASGLVLYAWAPLVVPGETLRGSSSLPWWMPWVAPPVLYGLLLVGLPGLTGARRVIGTAALWVFHASLTLVVPPIATALGIAYPDPWAESLWGFPAAPVIQLLAVPLIAFPLRDLLVPPSRRRGFGAERTPTPAPLRTGRGWDDAGMHTVGGERLRDTPGGGEPTPDWRRDARDLVPPRSVPGGSGRRPGGTDTTPPPSKLASRTPTPPRFFVEPPAPEPQPAVPSLTIDTDVLVPKPLVAPEPTPTPPRVEAAPPVPGLPTIDTDVLIRKPPVPPAPVRPEPPPPAPSLATMDTKPLVLEAPVVVAPVPPPAPSVATMDTEPLVAEAPVVVAPVPPPAPSVATMDTEPLVAEAPVVVAPVPPPAPSVATMDTEPLVAEAPVVAAPVPPPAPSVATMDTEPLIREPQVAPEPVIVEPRPAPILPAAPMPVVAAVPPSLPAVDPAEIAGTLAPVGALEIEHETLMGVDLYTACGPRLARAVVTNTAFRALTFLVETPAAEPVTQTTLRGTDGALVVTPLGPRPGVGPVLAVALPQRGALALVEILALRVAAEYRATHSAGSAPPAPAATPPVTFREAPVPARVEALVRPLLSGGALRPLCLQDATGDLTLHLLLEPGADAERLGRLASSLYRIMEAEAGPGGIGPVQSVVVRLGSQRVVVQPVAVAGGRSTLLVAATDRRPGLTRLQLERVAARLGGTPS